MANEDANSTRGTTMSETTINTNVTNTTESTSNHRLRYVYLSISLQMKAIGRELWGHFGQRLEQEQSHYVACEIKQ